MIIKYVNPVFDAPSVSEVSDAYVCKNIDDDGNPMEDWVLMINAKDEYYTSILIQGETFSNLCQMVNDLYDNGKLDITSNGNIDISIYPRGLDSMQSMDLEEFADLFGDDFLEDE